MSEGNPELEKHADWKAPSPEEGRRQYAPGEIADLERSRAENDVAIDVEIQRLRGLGWSEKDAKESIQTDARQKMEFDLRKREAEMKRIKPKDKDKVLGEINRFWEDINQALNYKPESPLASVIDKDWAEAMLKVLNGLEEQIKFEGSFPTQVFEKEELKTRGLGLKWKEPKWVKKIEALRMALRDSGDEYTETSAEERQRRLARDQAIAKAR